MSHSPAPYDIMRQGIFCFILSSTRWGLHRLRRFFDKPNHQHQSAPFWRQGLSFFSCLWFQPRHSVSLHHQLLTCHLPTWFLPIRRNRCRDEWRHHILTLSKRQNIIIKILHLARFRSFKKIYYILNLYLNFCLLNQKCLL